MMTHFHNVNFPLHLAFGASAGPQRETEIIALASGGEHRNNRHANSRRRYDAGTAIKHIADAKTLITFFEARGGQLYGFRFRDPLDNATCAPGDDIAPGDQIIGTGDGTQTEFQLVKTYADAAGSWTRTITKPFAVVAQIDGTQTSVTFDDLTGVISFASPPPLGAVIKAGFEFDVPARFDIDQLDLAPESFASGKPFRVPLLELRHA